MCSSSERCQHTKTMKSPYSSNNNTSSYSSLNILHTCVCVCLYVFRLVCYIKHSMHLNASLRPKAVAELKSGVGRNGGDICNHCDRERKNSVLEWAKLENFIGLVGNRCIVRHAPKQKQKVQKKQKFSFGT